MNRLKLLSAPLLAIASLSTSFGGGAPDPTDWSIASTSSVSLIGSKRFFTNQDVGVAAAATPDDWRTVSVIVFPQVDLAVGQFVDVTQIGTAVGTHAVTGQMALAVPLRVRDSDGNVVDLQADLTTEQTSGTDIDGGQICPGPSVCNGTRRNATSGALQLVAIVKIPAGSGTFVDGQSLLIEIDGTIVPANSDGDGIEDFLDNCPSVSNVGQQDLDLDGIGNACDDCTDLDRDGYGAPGNPACLSGSATDCDDDDDTIYPNGPEFCDGLDNDCDLSADNAVCSDFDVDLDSFVDGVELAWLGRAFGECSANPAAEWWFEIDIFTDGCIDGDDLALLTVAWDCDPGPICD